MYFGVTRTVIALHLCSRIGVGSDESHSLHSLHLADREETVVFEQDDTLDSSGVGELLSFGSCNVFPAEVLVGTAVEKTNGEQSLVQAGEGLVHACDGCLIVC